MILSPDARLVPRPEVAAREIGDGAVLVHMGSGECFELNGIGFEIWKALAQGSSTRIICQALVGRYAVGPEVLAADVGKLAEALVGAGLVEVK